jgi:uncharacterized protein YjiS (DUF1127 family)
MARPMTRFLRAIAADLHRRQAMRALMASEDRMLADIGITRGDIEVAVLRGRRVTGPCGRSG